MNLMEIEQAARVAWPALDEEELPFGVLRYSHGLDRRSNSLSLHPDAVYPIGCLVTATENFFAERGAVPIVRIVLPSGVVQDKFAEVDNALALRGYMKQAPTLSMLCELNREPTSIETSEECLLTGVDADTWLEAWYHLMGRSVEKLALHKALLCSSKQSYLFLLKRSASGVLLSSGMAAYANGAIGVFGIATANGHRKNGHGYEVVDALLHWGLSKKARYAYLQVEASNQAAISLYQKLHFESSYSYWYRVGQEVTRTGED